MLQPARTRNREGPTQLVAFEALHFGHRVHDSQECIVGFRVDFEVVGVAVCAYFWDLQMAEQTAYTLACEIRDLYARQCAYADRLRSMQNDCHKKLVETCRARNHLHIPELNHFSNVFEQQDALQQAMGDKAIKARKRRLQTAVWVVVFADCIAIQLYSAAQWPLGVIALATGGLLILSFQYLPRQRELISKHLREQLADRGVPICVGCGYDLRGQTIPRCPECGLASALAFPVENKELTRAG